MTREDAIKLREARRVRVRRIRARVIGGSVALFLAAWLLITVVLVTGHDPALARRTLTQAASPVTTTTSGSTATAAASTATTSGSAATATGSSDTSSSNSTGSAGSGATSSSTGSSGGVSSVTSSQS